MSNQPRKPVVTKTELIAAFDGEWENRFPPILHKKQVAEMLGISESTISEWKQKGRLDGSFRKRGKHVFFWRDKVIDIVFNGKEW